MKPKRMALNEVKDRFSQVVDGVEKGEGPVIITKHGRDAVVLKPLHTQGPGEGTRLVKRSTKIDRFTIQDVKIEDLKAALRDVDRLAQTIGKHWQGDASAVDAVREQRRDL